MKSRAQLEKVLHSMMADPAARPSSLVEHTITDKGIELRLFFPADKLTAKTARSVVALLMSDAM
jgi:hypothetical protein